MMVPSFERPQARSDHHQLAGSLLLVLSFRRGGRCYDAEVRIIHVEQQLFELLEYVTEVRFVEPQLYV